MSIFRKKLKVFYSIVAPISIDMMDSFTFPQKAPQVFFHYKMVFTNIVAFITTGVVWFVNKYISPNLTPSTFPCPTFIAFWGILVSALKTTESSPIIMFCKKFFATPFASQGNTVRKPQVTRTKAVSNAPLCCKFPPTTRGTSYSLSPTIFTLRNFIATDNTFYHSTILPQITINVKECYHAY